MRLTKIFLCMLALALFAGNARAELYMGISGKVVEEGSNIPLSNVQLVLFSQDKGKIAEGKSDAKGSFVIRGIPKGIYHLIALPANEFTIPLKTPLQITVPSGKNVVGINIRLQKGCALKGRVVANNGVGIPKARVLSKGASSTTDDQGYFTLKGLAPGTVKVGIMPVALGTKITTAACEAGKTSDMANTVFSFGPETAIQGTVTDTNGNPVKGAILTASNSTTGGYTFSSNKGTFFLAGLNTDTYTLNVVAFGYEAKTVTGVASPSANLNIVLATAQNTAAGIVNYKFTKNKKRKDITLSKIGELLAPREAFAGGCVDCPEGKWWGVSADMGGMPLFEFYGGSVSVGYYICRSSSVRKQFSAVCDYYGVSGTTLLNVGVGASGMLCSGACCSKELFGASNGAYIQLNVLSKASAGALDFSDGTTCFTASYQLGDPFGLWSITDPDDAKRISEVFGEAKKLVKYGGFVGYRKCEVQELVNIFEWYCTNKGICL